MNKHLCDLRRVNFTLLSRSFTRMLLIGFACLLPVWTFAQLSLISLKMESVALSRIIEKIEQDSEYTFFYNDDQINLNRKVSVDVKEAPVEKVLDEIFRNSGYGFRIVENQIVVSRIISEHPESISGNPSLLQKGIAVKGNIKDVYGEPVIGASVVERGTNNGTVSDVNGDFGLTIPEYGKQLIVSYLGYDTETITLKQGQQFIEVIMKENNKLLDEVVIVAYGTQKKINLTGSVATVSTEDIKDRVQTDVLSAVQGTVPGVTIISRPGSTPSINFRGRGNLGTSEPLYVIDGAIADASFFSNLDPNSIESISFLKDAASSSMYGSRAAYGVVLVTTKRGKTEKMNVSYSGYVGFSNPTYKPDLVNSTQYAELYNEALYNSNPSAGKYQGFTEEEIGWFRDGSKPDLYPNTNWGDLILNKNVPITQHSVNLSGGTEKVRFFTGLGYVYREEFMPGRENQRYNLNMNVNADITSWLTFRAGVKYIRNTFERDQGSTSLANFLIVPSTFVAKHSDGRWGTVNGGQTASSLFILNNPLRALSTGDWSNSKTENTMYDLGFDIKPVAGLVISGQGVFKGYEYKGKSYTALQENAIDYFSGEEIAGTGITKNQMSMDWRSNTRMLYTGTVAYDRTIRKHSIGGIMGLSYEHYKSETLGASRENFPADSFKDMSAGATTGAEYKNSSESNENKMFSYFARLNYIYDERYLVEVNFRSDASSRFHKDHRWGYFPSFSAGWRISEEAFMAHTKSWLDNLKIRGSYGTLGNINNVGNYDYFQNYSASANYSFSDEAVKGIKESKPANSSLGWEKVALTDIGIDMDVWNGLLSLSADYYIKNTSDILLGYNVPRETGISTVPSQNIGKIRNKGFEFALTHRNQLGDFKYSVGFNVATNRNEILNLASSDNIIQGSVITYILKEGEAIGSYFGYKTDGLYTQEDIDKGIYYTMGGVTPNAGDVKFLPQREEVQYGDAITAEDRTIIGNDVPKFTYGLNLNLQYRNFEFSLFGQGVGGTDVAFDVYQIHPFFHGMDNPRVYHLSRWTEDNPNRYAAYPRIYSASSVHTTYNRNFSDYHLFNADYFRLKSITLGYSIPTTVVKNWGMSALKVYVTGENLFTIRADNKMKDFDPETAGGVIGTLGTKSIAFGINVTF